MKYLYALLLFLVLLSGMLVAPQAHATDLVVSNNASFLYLGDSFDYEDDAVGANNIAGFQFEAFVHSYLLLNNPATNIYFDNASRAGGLMNDFIQNAASIGTPWFGYQSNNFQHIGISRATENGSLDYNQMYLADSNLFLFPHIMTNGVGNTNEPGWAQNNTVQWIGMGDIPGYGADGSPTTHGAQNDAGTNAGWTLGFMGVDLWHTNLNAWTNDYTAHGGTNVGWIFKPSPHPGKGGQLNAAFSFVKQITTDFDVSTCMLDGAGSVSATNHCVISSVVRTGNTLTFNRKDDRLPMAWYVPSTYPNGAAMTNDCRGAFNLNPSDGNLFRFTLQITNLTPGNYSVQIDGVTVAASLSSTELANGWNMFTNYVGPYWNQRIEVLGRILDMENVNRTSLKPSNSAGLGNLHNQIGARWNAGDRGETLRTNTTISNAVAACRALEDLAHAAAQPTNHTFQIVQNGTNSPPPIRIRIHR